MPVMKALFGGISPAEAQRDPGAWLEQGIGNGGFLSTSGVSVGPDNAITLSAVFAAARAISEDVGCLPLKAYRVLPGGGKESTRDDARWHSPEFDDKVNVYDLVHDAPNSEMSDLDFRSLLVWWASLWGNGYAEVVRDSAANPVAIHPIHPHLVTPKRDANGRLYYEVRSSSSVNVTIIRPPQMIHVSGPSNDGVVGLMITKYAKNAFGVYMAAEQFTGSFFGNGATLAGVIMFDQDFKTNEARSKYREEFNRVYAGARNSNKWMLADGGAKVQTLSSNPEDSQLAETLRFRIEDVARWFRVPPVIIGHNTSTPYSNVESLGQIYTKFGLKPWAKRIEKELNRKLLGYDKDQFVEHVIDSLMWADAKTRAEVHAINIRTGMATPDEARSTENRNPYPGGNRFRVEQNLALIDENGEPVQVNQPAAQQPPAPSQDGGSAEAYKLAAMPMFVDAAERMIRREAKAFAAKADPDDAWIDKFYEGHRGEVAAAFGPAINTLSRLCGSKADGLAERYADMHVGESKRRLSEGEDPAVWATDRPAWVARFLTDEVGNG